MQALALFAMLLVGSDTGLVRIYNHKDTDVTVTLNDKKVVVPAAEVRFVTMPSGMLNYTIGNDPTVYRVLVEENKLVQIDLKINKVPPQAQPKTEQTTPLEPETQPKSVSPSMEPKVQPKVENTAPTVEPKVQLKTEQVAPPQAAENKPAELLIYLPSPFSRIVIDDYDVQQKQESVRLFVSPPLEVGRSYSYNVVVDGKQYKVKVTGGERSTLDAR